MRSLSTCESAAALRADAAAAARRGCDQVVALGLKGLLRQHGMRCVDLYEEKSK